MSEWISVNDRLPHSGEVCLVYGANAADWARKVSLWEGGQWFDDGKELPDVSHWMPLPPPPAPTMTVKEALREAVEFIAEVEDSIGKIGFYGQRDRELTWRGNLVLPRLRAALESEE